MWCLMDFDGCEVGIATACDFAFIYVVLYVYDSLCYILSSKSFFCELTRATVCTSLFHVMLVNTRICYPADNFQVRKFGSQIWPQTLVEIVATQQLLKGLLGAMGLSAIA